MPHLEILATHDLQCGRLVLLANGTIQFQAPHQTPGPVYRAYRSPFGNRADEVGRGITFLWGEKQRLLPDIAK